MPEARRSAAAKHPTTSRDSNTAHIRRTAPSTTLPREVQISVPQCAQLCLDNYIKQEYSCADNDYDCLCRQYSLQGFTLGELAYVCLEKECEQANKEDSRSAYFLCASKAGAVRPTHRTLTLPATTASPSGISKTTPETARTISRSHRSTNFHTANSEPTRSTGTTDSAMPATMVPHPSRPTSTPSTTAAGAASTLHSTGLNGAQSAGISIAAIGTVVIVIAAIYLIICFRRRRVTHRADRKSYDFVDEAPPRFSPFNYGYADPRGPLGGFHDRRAELMAEKTNLHPQWYQSRPGHGHFKQYEKHNEVSPNSYGSNDTKRTLSQLLPDKPGPMFSRPWPKSPAPSAITATTVFEEDQAPPVPTLKPLPKLPPAGLALHYPPPRKPVKPSYAQQYTRSPDEARHPSLSLDIPKQAARSSRIPSPVAFPLPPNINTTPVESEQQKCNTSKTRSRESDGSVLNYYASPEAGHDGSPVVDSPTPIEAETQKRKPVPNAITVTRPTYHPQAVRITSIGSDTSFESNDDDEPTPPEELERHLTPVQEAPSPIAGIRYPKVPRSSNQSVPRSPGLKLSPSQKWTPQPPRRPPVAVKKDQISSPIPIPPKAEKKQDPVTPKRQDTDTSTLSGSTLAVKRLGTGAAQGPQGKLHLDLTHARANSHANVQSKSEPNSGKSVARRSDKDSPLKGYGRVASGGGRRPSRDQTRPPSKSPEPEMKSPEPHLWRSPGLPGEPQDVVLKSPLWEPKLTPSRRGNDLYLNVGIATPRTAGFTPLTDRFAR